MLSDPVLLHNGQVFRASDFLTGLKSLRLLKADLTSKDQGEEGIE